MSGSNNDDSAAPTVQYNDSVVTTAKATSQEPPHRDFVVFENLVRLLHALQLQLLFATARTIGAASLRLLTVTVTANIQQYYYSATYCSRESSPLFLPLVEEEGSVAKTNADNVGSAVQ